MSCRCNCAVRSKDAGGEEQPADARRHRSGVYWLIRMLVRKTDWVTPEVIQVMVRARAGEMCVLSRPRGSPEAATSSERTASKLSEYQLTVGERALETTSTNRFLCPQSIINWSHRLMRDKLVETTREVTV